MKFVLVSNPRYWWPVTVRIPGEEAGKIAEQQLKVLFEPQGRDEAIASQEAYGELKTERERADHEKKQLLLVVKNWDDVLGEDKTPVPFSEEILAQAIQQRWFRDALYRAYAESLSGLEAQLGN
ncbi:hypothetical protein [Ochrobactrum chromiisoli]|uniref:Tail assembly chaperone n=1 Tax=Ochrobactrum chromiisoli TaxID=2993941 RepID=A0ABT3QN79_9HYPH|nr:hypothetical protein [Ochrobactrum chromiisoli]MCX2697073.1 hypothetical protein [Ochrobactrum chromiisoli]